MEPLATWPMEPRHVIHGNPQIFIPSIALICPSFTCPPQTIRDAAESALRSSEWPELVEQEIQRVLRERGGGTRLDKASRAQLLRKLRGLVPGPLKLELAEQLSAAHGAKKGAPAPG